MSTQYKIPKIRSGILSEAVKHYWIEREKGLRRGIHMDGFLDKIQELLLKIGTPSDAIITDKKGVTLPGYYRPTKEWDLVVVSNSTLIAAIELKSMGCAYGKNLNNRIEEALGSSTDFWSAYKENIFVTNIEKDIHPWLGYLFLLGWRNDNDKKDVDKVQLFSNRTAHFKIFDVHKTSSYAIRTQELCEKLVEQELYSSVCFITSDERKKDSKNNYSEPSKDVSVAQFLTTLLNHVKASLDKLGIT